MRPPRRRKRSSRVRPLWPEEGGGSALGYGPWRLYAEETQSGGTGSTAARASLVACVTGATGFVGGHVARLLVERGDDVRVTYRDSARLGRLGGRGAGGGAGPGASAGRGRGGERAAEPVKADVLDRAAVRRAVRGC